MGNKTSTNSTQQIKDDEFHELGCFAPPHFTFFTPIFGHPLHVNSFIRGSSSINTVYNLYGDFILAPWFQRIAENMTNEEVLTTFSNSGFDRPPRDLIPKTWEYLTGTTGAEVNPAIKVGDDGSVDLTGGYYDDNDGSSDCEDFLPKRNGKKNTTPHSSPNSNPNQSLTDRRSSPIILPWAAQKIVLDSNSIETLIPRHKNDKSPYQPPPLLYHNSTSIHSLQHNTTLTHHINDHKPQRNHKVTTKELPLPPTHVPFLKIALLKNNCEDDDDDNHQNSIWLPFLYADSYNFHHLDYFFLTSLTPKILPLRGLSPGKYWEPHKYSFETKKPLFDPLIPMSSNDPNKTESDLFSSSLYPRTSLFRVEPLIGYDFNEVALFPHVSEIPAKHLCSILILDMISQSALITLSNFIRETLTLLSKGCILPLTNVEIFIIQLNADKLDSVVIRDGDIVKALEMIGFTKISFSAIKQSRYFTHHLPSLLKKPTWCQDFHYYQQTGVTHVCPVVDIDQTPPLMSRKDLKVFSQPIWTSIYTYLFYLNNIGYWDRLYQWKLKPGSTLNLVPPHVYPNNFYIGLKRCEMHDYLIKNFQLSLKTNLNILTDILKNNQCSSFPSFIQMIELIAYWKSVRNETYYEFVKDVEGLLEYKRKSKQMGPEAIKKGSKYKKIRDASNKITRITIPAISNIVNEDYQSDKENQNSREISPPCIYGEAIPNWSNVNSYLPHNFLHISDPLPLQFPLGFIPEHHNQRVPIPIQYQHCYSQQLDIIDYEEGVGSNSDNNNNRRNGNNNSPSNTSNNNNTTTINFTSTNSIKTTLINSTKHSVKNFIANVVPLSNIGYNTIKNDVLLGDVKNNKVRNGFCESRSGLPRLISPFGINNMNCGLHDNDIIITSSIGTDNNNNNNSNNNNSSLDDNINNIHSLLGLPNTYEFESFLLWDPNVLISDPNGLFTSNVIHDVLLEHSKLKRMDSIVNIINQEGFKIIDLTAPKSLNNQLNLESSDTTSRDNQTTVDKKSIVKDRIDFKLLVENSKLFKGTLLDENTITSLTNQYYLNTITPVPNPQYITNMNAIFDNDKHKLRVNIVKNVMWELLSKFLGVSDWGELTSPDDVDHSTGPYYPLSLYKIPPAIFMHIHPRSTPLTYASSRSVWEVTNHYQEFSQRIILEAKQSPKSVECVVEQSKCNEQVPQTQSQNVSTGSPCPPLTVKMTYFYQHIDLNGDDPSAMFGSTRNKRFPNTSSLLSTFDLSSQRYILIENTNNSYDVNNHHVDIDGVDGRTTTTTTTTDQVMANHLSTTLTIPAPIQGVSPPQTDHFLEIHPKLQPMGWVLKDCSYYTHPLSTTASAFTPLAWLHGVIILPFLYIRKKSEEFIANHHMKSSIDQDNNNTNMTGLVLNGVEYPHGFVPPPIPSLPSAFSAHSQGSNNHNTINRMKLSSLGGSGYRNITPNGGLVKGETLASYNCPINFIVVIMNPVLPDPFPYQDVDLSGVNMGNTVDDKEIINEKVEVLTNDDKNTFQNVTVNPLFEPITQSQYNYFQHTIPSLYKRQLINGGFTPYSYSQKLQKLWNVHFTQIDQLSTLFQQCEEESIKIRLKLYYDAAIRMKGD